MHAGRVYLGLLAGLLAVACSSSIRQVGDGFRHRDHDFSIAAPKGLPAWQRTDVEDAALAFERQGPGGRDLLSLVSRCGRPTADAQLMARHLVIGLGDRTVVAAGPLEVEGHSGWTQTFDTLRDGVPVRIKTVTLVVGRCSFDWILAAAGPIEPAEASFDAWWGSFRLGRRHAAGSGG